MLKLYRSSLGSGSVVRSRVSSRVTLSLALSPARNRVHRFRVFASAEASTAADNDTGVSCHVFDARVTLPDTHRSSAKTWGAWMTKELSSKLVGLTAGTSRAQVRIVALRSASVRKGPIRAEEVDLVLELEGLHKKETEGKLSGAVRLLLKTEDARDQICISDAIWDPEQLPLSKQVQADIMAAADKPLESALAALLNDLLWDVERRSIDESMDE